MDKQKTLRLISSDAVHKYLELVIGKVTVDSIVLVYNQKLAYSSIIDLFLSCTKRTEKYYRIGNQTWNTFEFANNEKCEAIFQMLKGGI